MPEHDANFLRLESEARQLKLVLDEITTATNKFGAVFSGTISGAVVQGKSFQQVLEQIRQRILALALRQALAPLENHLNSFFGSLTSSLFSGPAASPASTSQSVPSVLTATQAPPVIFNVTANDPGAFRNSEAQISALLARTVSRAARAL